SGLYFGLGQHVPFLLKEIKNLNLNQGIKKTIFNEGNSIAPIFRWGLKKSNSALAKYFFTTKDEEN
ncbi:MAG: hypothetical protein R6V37_07170, partial [Psychroflexus maritimus]